MTNELKRHRFYADFTGIHHMEDAARFEEEEEVGAPRVSPEEFTDIIQTAYPLDVGQASDDTINLILRSAYQPGSTPKPDNDDSIAEAIGLSGFAQTGKTTVANYIQEKYGYRRQHIADPLRDMLRTLLRRFRVDDELIERYLTGDLKEKVIPCLGVTSRRAQITIGTEWGRDLIDPDLWARLWKHQAEYMGGKAMNDSVRFPNEEAAIHGLYGGFTIMVTRPGAQPAAFKWGRLGRFLYTYFGLMWGVHDSERVDRLSPDYIIVNDGTIEELYEQVDRIFETQAIASSLPTAAQL